MSIIGNLPAKKILVVDDNQVILNVVSSGLASAGYQVFTAIDGAEAFQVVRRQKPDLIVLDIVFPPDIEMSGNTWDGFLIMRWLRRMSEAHDIPVVIISGGEPEKFRDRAFEAGALAYFQKPVEMHELLAIIRPLLEEAPEEVAVPVAAMSHADSARASKETAYLRQPSL